MWRAYIYEPVLFCIAGVYSCLVGSSGNLGCQNTANGCWVRTTAKSKVQKSTPHFVIMLASENMESFQPRFFLLMAQALHRLVLGRQPQKKYLALITSFTAKEARPKTELKQEYQFTNGPLAQTHFHHHKALSLSWRPTSLLPPLGKATHLGSCLPSPSCRAGSMSSIMYSTFRSISGRSLRART